MKLKSILVLVVVLIALATAVPAFANGPDFPDPEGPCFDAGADGPDGVDYAHYHIVPRAITGALGAGGHVPGAHKGFSLCLGVH
jgi:hypothetical protein